MIFFCLFIHSSYKNVAKLRIDEIQTINNLKHAWLFILNSINSKNDMNLLKSINSLVGSNLVDNTGQMRKYEVNIGGTNWKPEIPDENTVNDKIWSILNDDNKTITEKSLTIMCYLMRTQFLYN